MKETLVEKITERVDEFRNKGTNDEGAEERENMLQIDLDVAKKFLKEKIMVDDLEYVPQYFVMEHEYEEIKIPRKEIEELVEEELKRKRKIIKRAAIATGAAVAVGAGVTAVAVTRRKK